MTKIGLYPWGILWVYLGYHLARYRVWIEKGCMKARVLTLIVAQYYKERALIVVWWDKIVLDRCVDLFDEIGDLRGFEVRGKWMFMGGCGGKIDILIISRTGVTIRKNLVTIRKKVAKGVAYVGFFLYLCSRF